MLEPVFRRLVPAGLDKSSAPRPPTPPMKLQVWWCHHIKLPDQMGGLQCGIKRWVEKGGLTSPLLFWCKPASLIVLCECKMSIRVVLGNLHPAALWILNLVQHWLIDKKNLLCVSLRSYVNEVILEYILCGCLYFVNFMTTMACLVFQKKVCARCK